MAQKFERVVEEDLNVGTAPAWVCCPGSGELRATQVGIHSVARGQKAYTATWAPGAIAAGSNASTTITVKDAYIKDFIMASHDKILTSALRISGHVSAAETVKVVIHNPTAASITVASGMLKVIVFPQCSAQVSAAADPLSVGINGLVTFTPTVTLGTPPYTYLWTFAYPDLFAAWNMDDASGGYRTDFLGNYDLLDQTAAGGLVALVAGAVGNGTSYLNGVAFSNTAAVEIPATFTITGWFYISVGANNNQYLISYGVNTTPGTVTLHVWPSQFDGVRFFTDDDPGDEADSGVAITVGDWHFFSASHDSATGTNTIQVDDSVPVTVATQPDPAAAPQEFRIARHAGGSGQLYGGLDALQIWSKILSAGEIAAIKAGWEPSSPVAENPSVEFPMAGVVVATVTATDATGCTASDTVDVTVIDFSVTVTAAQIEGGTDGDAIVVFAYVVTGGTAPYTYSLAWTGGGGGGPNTDVDPTITFTGGVPLEYDTIPYTLTVTDDTLAVTTYSSSVDIQYWDAP